MQVQVTFKSTSSQLQPPIHTGELFGRCATRGLKASLSRSGHVRRPCRAGLLRPGLNLRKAGCPIRTGALCPGLKFTR